MGLLIRWLVTAIAIVVAAEIVPGIDRGDWQSVAVAAIVLGLVNAFIKPILKLLSLPLVPITLGAILLVINVFCFWLAGWISEEWFDGGLEVDGIMAAIGGAIVVSIVSFIANMFIDD